VEKITIKNAIPQVLKGAAMGIAEVIPGVSGGTIAFITGIYEQLLRSIKAFGPEAIKGFREKGVVGFWEAINGNFLLTLLVGMAAGMILGVFGVTWVLENYPVLLWSFFFGLILGSVVFVARMIKQWNYVTVLAFIIGTAIAYFITIASPAEGNQALWFVFVSGMLAICALMLPGISGSFILLLMGMYTFIIPTVKNALKTFDPSSIKVLIVFAAGALVGLGGFSRVLTWTFKKYHDQTMGLLAGFMLGSLNKIWPWRNVISFRQNSKGIMVPFQEESVLPFNFEGDTFLYGSIALMVIGLISVFLLEKMSDTNPG
jgi:putative membrane protein